ncbi:Mur ligase family protein [Candidatus Aquiluna sp. UB-MaderosW2red]|uniref:Mur ligase family protein n=1 Tax=Candidatus Aquiluna sp. UB-MaderosW2red TaxID=1855377 RepID=UPI000875AB6D|nr:UDP-N-acetylmuramoyl-L-alanyl-D-glutamate--2,6-diaminopimelate ligase [Candidatus Aquiluna sp. UB-MaderosW2red]SCX12667.1 UDP-N-acetylmuramoyl-L-alanyl-D-glutamate--2,6-diaminopimelate ligase [Candidatus Aquiluna sp. UB-MaderosW2red]
MVSSQQLADEFGLELVGESRELNHVALHTDKIRPGSLYIAAQGARNHGIEFLESAIHKGAITVLTDAEHARVFGLPCLIHPEPRKVAGVIAARIFGEPAGQVQLFGITGTNGKTSTASYLARILQLCLIPTGLSASTGRFLSGEVLPSSLTSPEVTELHELLAKMVSQGLEAGVIEVSAQALVRNRVDAVMFQVAGFTNLSRDHMDDFESMENYLAAKSTLFTKSFAARGVVFVEDDFARRLAQNASIPIETVGKSGTDWIYSISQGGVFKIEGPGGKLNLSFNHGELMAKNFALAIAMAIAGGVGVEMLQAALVDFDFQVPGRLERVSVASPAIFIDYAHTPSGVQEAVLEIRKRFSHLTLILGASGNRDTGKRLEMGRAAREVDFLVITDQHPRDEDPTLIRSALKKGALEFLEKGQVLEIADPEKALEEAFRRTPRTGAILWCGPGNLGYREISGVKTPFDARALARKLVDRD